MQCKVKNSSSQDELTSDLTAKQVCQILGVGQNWLTKHRDKLEYYRIPGRGRTGQSIRFTRKSVERYIRERIRAQKEAVESENPYKGKTIAEIREIAKERVRRGLVSTSS